MESKKELNTIEDIKTYADFVKFSNANMILCNNIVNQDNEFLFENIVNGELEDDTEIFQYFLIDNHTKEMLEYFTDELVFYSENLDVYVWGITHFGTGWDYVDITLKNNKL